MFPCSSRRGRVTEENETKELGGWTPWKTRLNYKKIEINTNVFFNFTPINPVPPVIKTFIVSLLKSIQIA